MSAIKSVLFKIKEEIAEFEKDGKVARLDSIVTLANAAKELSLRDTKEQLKRELAEIDQQLAQLKGMERIPGIDTVIQGLQKKRSDLLAKCGASSSAQAAPTAKPSRQYAPRSSEAEEDACWGDLCSSGEPAAASKPKSKPAGGAGQAASTGEKRPKHVVPCKAGTTCVYGLRCTFFHSHEELESFKYRTTK
jgi:hypothetical protein